MNKVVRNTVFTIILLVLTGLGLNWNTALLAKDQPLSIEKSVVSAQTTGSFNVGVTFNKSSVTLGQNQTISIVTEPNANLKIVVQYAGGIVDEAFTARTNPDGSYIFGFTENNFRNTGVVIVKVLATSDKQTSQGEAEFNLTP